MGLVSWIGSAFASAPVAEAAPAAGPPEPRRVTRTGFEFGISDQGLSEWSPGVQSQEMDRRTLMQELYDAYITCPWAWAGVNAIARRITAGTLGFEYDPGEDADGDEETPEKPPEVVLAEKLFAFVNERENMRQLLRGIITDLLVFGDAFIEVVWVGKQPVALFSLDCPSTTPIADKHGQITGYVQLTDYGQRAEFEPHEVIHISLDAPRSGVFGISPLQAALLPINRWLFAAATQLQTYRKGDPLNLHVDLPAEMTGPDVRRWISQHMARNVGPANIGYPIVTKGGGQVNELGARRLADNINTLETARDEILATLGVPPAKAGVIESGNIGGGTDEGQDRTFTLQTCDPIEALVLDAIQFHLAWRGFKVPANWKVRISEVDLRDTKTIEEIRETRFKNGAYTLNEWRAEIGKPPIEGGDQALILVSQGSVMRVRDIEASTLAGLAKQVSGSGWEIDDQGDEDSPITLVKSAPAEDTGGEWGYDDGGDDGWDDAELHPDEQDDWDGEDPDEADVDPDAPPTESVREQRVVRTSAGSKKFALPIGATITKQAADRARRRSSAGHGSGGSAGHRAAKAAQSDGDYDFDDYDSARDNRGAAAAAAGAAGAAAGAAGKAGAQAAGKAAAQQARKASAPSLPDADDFDDYDSARDHRMPDPADLPEYDSDRLADDDWSWTSTAGRHDATSGGYVEAARTSPNDWADDVDDLVELDDLDDGATHDSRLAEMWRIQGFDGPPQVVSPEEFEALGDDHVRVYRGLSGDGAEDYAEDFRSGDVYAGVGVHGNGTYTSTSEATAEDYAGVDPAGGATLRMALPPGARIGTPEDVWDAWDEAIKADPSLKPVFRAMEGDTGKLATALGFDAVHIAGDYMEKDESYYVVLNRTALLVEGGS